MKILIIGLDGVDPEILQKFMEAGKLPYFSKLKNEGIFARMVSTIPTLTPVAWTTMLTGRNPGKHGIGGFVKYKPNSYDIKILNSLDRGSDTLWHILNQHKKSVGIFNYPTLYPPEEIDRFMVCGMITPNIKCKFTYPDNLQREILENVPGYDIDVRIVKAAEDKVQLLKDIYQLTDNRFIAANYLMEKYPCDVFIFVLTETDRLLHYYMSDLKYGLTEKNTILQYFQYLDKKLGEFVEKVDDDTIVFLVSDHGMCEIRKTFYVNKWLIQQGLLKINMKSLGSVKHTSTRSFIQGLSRFCVKFHINIEKIKDYFPEKLSNFITFLYCYYGGIDWAKTKAYFSLAGLGIIINRKGSWPEGIVREDEYESLRDNIIKGLEELKDPHNGSRVIERVYRREELFKGEYLHRISDLIIKFSEGYVPAESTQNQIILEDLGPKEFLRGVHRLYGIFFAYNKKYIKPSLSFPDINILDIAPTVLYKLGIPVSEDFDGRALKEIFKDGDTNTVGSSAVSISEQLRERIKELKLAGKIK
jgi:predicted AlkP superfamily phosphohydrolase/phosphomutase